MSTIVKDVVIPNNHRIKIEVEVPPTVQVGEATMTLILEPKVRQSEPKNMAAEMFGKGKSKVWIAEDFDAPLEDFAEYM